MAKQRIINTQFWDDKYIRSLLSNGKLIFAYLFTGPLATISGAYEITVDHIVFHTGVNRIETEAWLEQFEADKKAKFLDGWVLVYNTIEHQTTSNTKIRKGVEESLKCCPEWIKHSLSIRYHWLSHLNPNLNLNSNSNKEAAATQAEAAVKESDLVERRIWKDGLDLLTQNGTTEANARPLLGRLVKQYTKPLVAQAIAVTQAENPADPKAFLIGVLKERSGANNKAASSVGKYDPSEAEPEIEVICGVCGKAYCLLTHQEALLPT